MAHRHWPLFDLRVTTPRVELRYPDDDTIGRLADLAAQGIHDPSTMPFARPWTDVPSPQLERNAHQFFWRLRGDWTVDNWELAMAVVVDGDVVGVQSILAKQYPLLRAFETGSWLAARRQGEGIGKEMRAAVLHLGFAGLGAAVAYTSAWHDNEASLGVTRALGYEPNGERVDIRRNTTGDRMLEFRMTRDSWETRRRDDVTIHGLEPCLPLFGLDE